MKREKLHVLSGHFGHPSRPSAVTPGNQLNRWIRRAHRFGKVDGLAGRRFDIKTISVIRGFVADLPVTNGEGGGHSEATTKGVSGIVAVRHPLSRLARVTGANAVL